MLIGEIEVNTLKTANIIANLSKENLQDIAVLKRIIRQNKPPMGGRMLVINKHGLVLADSHSLFEGKNINNIEISSALQGKEKLGYYQNDDILQVAVPIHRRVENVRQVEGTILIE